MSKALFVTMEFWPFRGGVARYYKNFCDEWEDVVVYTQQEVESRKVHKVENHKSSSTQPSQSFGGQAGSGGKVIPERTPHSAGEVEGYEVIRKPFFWKFIWPHWSKLLVDLLFYIRTHEPSIIFVGQILPVGTAAYLLQQIFHFDYGVFVHGLDILWAARGNRLKRWLTQRILRNSCLVIANSEYTKRITEELFGFMDEKTVVVSPKAYESENSQQPASTANRDESTVNRERPPLLDNLGGLPLVLSGGRLVARKGFHDVIEIAREFQGKAVFVIFGRGEDEQRLRLLIQTYNLEQTVFLLSQNLSDEELAEVYRSCDVFMFLPKELQGGDVEGFGQVVLEAQSHGKPVIVRDSGGAGEALVHEETGFLWKDGKLETLRVKLETLLQSEGLRREMGEKGKRFARTLTEEFDQRVRGMKKALVGQEKKVSIIIPVGYGVNRIIPTLKSIEQQTYKNLEVIIVGDGVDIPVIPDFDPGSKNKKQKGLFGVSFGFLDSRFHGNDSGSSFSFPHKVFSIPKSGAAAARNAGAARAMGEYLLFVDDDTRLRKDCVEKMVRRFEVDKFSTAELGSRRNIGTGLADSPKGSFVPSSARPSSNRPQYENSQPLTLAGEEISFVYSGFYFGWKAMPAVTFDRKTAYEYPYIDTTSMMRRDAFPGFDESLKRLQDWDLFLTILDRGGKGEAIHEYLYRKSARLFKNLLKWKGISFWFPKFVWKLPVAKRVYNLLPPVRRYNKSLRIVKEKHGV